jgi:hypothetical protein
MIGVAMILGVVFLFFLRIRTLIVMALTIGIGVAWTFGFAYYSIGSLNSSTGFLFSIVVGNGINFGIIYMARYLEARRAQEVVESIRIANRETWIATLSAAGAAMVAYGSLVVTGFRGFKHFGVIGGSGMVFCWVATYLFLPAILVLSERLVPVRSHGDILGVLRASYGRPFAYLVGRFPRAVSVVGVAVGIVCLGFTIQYLSVDPLEYNFHILKTDTPGSAIDVAQKLDDRIEPITGKQGHTGVAIMVDRIEQVLPLKAALEPSAAGAEGRNRSRRRSLFSTCSPPSRSGRSSRCSKPATSSSRRTGGNSSRRRIGRTSKRNCRPRTCGRSASGTCPIRRRGPSPRRTGRAVDPCTSCPPRAGASGTRTTSSNGPRVFAAPRSPTVRSSRAAATPSSSRT